LLHQARQQRGVGVCGAWTPREYTLQRFSQREALALHEMRGNGSHAAAVGCGVDDDPFVL